MPSASRLLKHKMNPRLLELMERRGELRARCAAQRQAIAADSEPLIKLFAVADQVHAGASWLRQNPAVVGVAAAVLVVLRPRRAWRLGRRGLMLWQGWRAVRQRLFSD